MNEEKVETGAAAGHDLARRAEAFPMEGQLATLIPPKYEYRVVSPGLASSAEATQDELNLYAQDGWKLIAVSNFGPSTFLYLERWVDQEAK